MHPVCARSPVFMYNAFQYKAQAYSICVATSRCCQCGAYNTHIYMYTHIRTHTRTHARTHARTHQKDAAMYNRKMPHALLDPKRSIVHTTTCDVQYRTAYHLGFFLETHKQFFLGALLPGIWAQVVSFTGSHAQVHVVSDPARATTLEKKPYAPNKARS